MVDQVVAVDIHVNGRRAELGLEVSEATVMGFSENVKVLPEADNAEGWSGAAEHNNGCVCSLVFFSFLHRQKLFSSRPERSKKNSSRDERKTKTKSDRGRCNKVKSDLQRKSERNNNSLCLLVFDWKNEIALVMLCLCQMLVLGVHLRLGAGANNERVAMRINAQKLEQ